MSDPAYDLADAVATYLNDPARSFPLAPAAFVSTDPAEDLERETATLKTLVIPYSDTEEPGGRTITMIDRAVHIVVCAPIGPNDVRALANLTHRIRKSLRFTSLAEHEERRIETLERLDSERLRVSNLFVSSFEAVFTSSEDASEE